MLLSNTIYIKIYENRVYIRNIDDRKEIELSSTSPFTTERLLIGNFTVAQTLLIKGIKIVMGKKFFVPIILMHPIEKIDGGLSQVEERVLKDLAIIVGAQKITLWVGQELTDKDVLQKVKQKQ
ncbi:MAG TPA: 1-pyrroline-5-carboxylate dehydrogenase [Nitrospirae bacterium]|nr:1-pyrroline-5-carboxylate dehydrogenase [Nitrospirota bacterium]HDZ00305.1 1-pyrroline-5-carboxylate dehydrogenase [Nitrospirota bacterium]